MQWNECLSYFNHSCVYCGDSNNLTQEHLTPLSKDGSYTKHNIVPACSCCNLGRGNSPLEEWYRRQDFFDNKRLKRIRKWQYKEGQGGLFDDGFVMKWK